MFVYPPLSSNCLMVQRSATFGVRDLSLPVSFTLEETRAMYRGQSGQWSWLFHRVTGLAILLFLLVHIVDITLIGFGPDDL